MQRYSSHTISSPRLCVSAFDASSRRGNTIILVIGILTLLVIIATGYVTRTQGARGGAIATGQAALREDNADNVAKYLAQDISDALFVRRINAASVMMPDPIPTLGVLDSNTQRLPLDSQSIRFSWDGYAPYNVAPYHVVPVTNWPDSNAASNRWPTGPGNTGSIDPIVAPLLAAESNAIGFPGTSDCRWLRDIEPLRWDSWNDAINPTGPGSDGVLDAFSHWRHVSYPPRPDNAIRAITDTADIGDATGPGNLPDGWGSLITNLNVPIEQWLAVRPNNVAGDLYSGFSGNPYVEGTPTDAPRPFLPFWNRWNNWFNFYETTYTDPNLVPTNCYKLNDLDANLTRHDWYISGVPQDRPESEFIPGTARNAVSRVLCDTDGNGYTDSFWFTVPGTVQDGIMQIMGVSIIDNCAMLNANVATRFLRNDFGAPFVPPGVIVPQPKKTIGVTPADVALLANMAIPAPGVVTFNNWNVGFYDSPDNQATNNSYPDFASGNSPGGDGGQWIYWAAMSDRHFGELNFPQLPAAALWVPTHQQRLEWWRRSAARPLSSDPTARYTPFNLADELELRMFYGQNYPWIYSRFEHSFEDFTIQSPPAPSPISRFLRAQTGREESSEYLNQLYNRQLVADHRHRLTLYNAARNDIAPPWLWQWGPNADLDGTGPFGPADLNGSGGPPDFNDRAIFEWGQRKFDLRIGHLTPIYGAFNLLSPFIQSDVYDLSDNLSIRNLGIALRDRIEVALMDDLTGLTSNPGTYFGNAGQPDIDKVRQLSASLAANFLERRDRDDPLDTTYTDETAFHSHAVPVKPNTLGATPTEGYIGMEPQPFILEVLVAHDYKAQPVVPPISPLGVLYANHDHYVVFDNDDSRSTIVVVQIANPFDRPIDLRNYRITVFGRTLDLSLYDPFSATADTTNYAPTWPWLAPGTPDHPTTAIFYAMREETQEPYDAAELDELRAEWRKFLDLEVLGQDGQPGTSDDDLTTDSIVCNVNDGADTVGAVWPIGDRSDYDNYTNDDGTVIISRIDDITNVTNPAWIVIDRVDTPGGDRDFGDAVNELGSQPIMDLLDTDPGLPPGPDPTTDYTPPTPLDPYPGIDLGITSSAYDHWVQWVRYVRPWGVDVNRDGTYDENEKNPRFVIGNGAVVQAGSGSTPDGSYINAGSSQKYRFSFDPDGLVAPATFPWFNQTYRLIDNQPGGAAIPYRKPFFFDMNRRQDPAWLNVTDPPAWSLPDKGWYGQGDGPNDDTCDCDISTFPPTVNTENVPGLMRVPMQVLHKDGDFEQVGELLNTWLFGHKLQLDFSVYPPTYVDTLVTFSEFMTNDSSIPGVIQTAPTGQELRTNRLVAGEVIGVGLSTDVTDPRHAIPDLPAGVRLLDAFVCDGIGVEPVPDLNGNGTFEQFEIDYRNALVFSNARNYEGTGTPGMININTAPPEVMRALPHWYRLVHESGGQAINPVGNPYFNAAGQPLVTDGSEPLARLPRSMVADGTVQYRERFNAGAGLPTVPVTGVLGGANYEDRPALAGGTLRGDRGIASIGEPLLLARSGIATFGYIDLPAGAPQDRVFNQYWRMDMGVEPAPLANPPIPAKPFWTGSTSADKQVSMRLSTDRVDEFDWENSDVFVDPPVVRKRPDTTAGDVEEANMLFAGASNIITTRSDTFTVYFRIRSFRQNTSVSPPVWDATNKDYIVDDSRYVMLVDRSTVNHPTDKPKILYLEKLPN
jgi:hypothetical protein